MFVAKKLCCKKDVSRNKPGLKKLCGANTWSKKAVFQNCNFVCEAPQELNRRFTRFLASEKVAQGGNFAAKI